MMMRILVGLVAVAVMALPGTAQAWRHWGWWGPGIIVAVPPPVYYGPPPGYYYAPPPPRAAGQACYAGAYVCPLDEPGPLGAPCSCPTNNGRAGGRIG